MQFNPYCRICGNQNPDTIHSMIYEKPAITTEEIVSQNLTGQEPYSTYVRLNLLFDIFLHNESNRMTFSVSLCPVCGFIFFTPCPDQEELIEKYHYLGKILVNSKESPYLKSRQKRVFNLISSKGCLKPGVKLLDYGGSKGDSLHLFSPTHDCFVLDYSPIKKYSDIHYIKGDFHCINPGTEFDAIFLQHTLEHVYDPSGLVKELIQHLRENGILYVEVPLGCFREYKIMKEPLTHINFFSEQSIAYMMNRLNLHIIHLSTNFQYVIDRKDWCINCIVQKKAEEKNSKQKVRTTKRQMRFDYIIPILLEQLRLKIYRMTASQAFL